MTDSSSMQSGAACRLVCRLAVGASLLGLACQGSPTVGAEPVTEGSAAPSAAAGPLKADGLEKLSPTELAERMMEVSGGSKMAQQVIDAMGQQLSNLPEGQKVLDELKKGMPEMIKQLTPIYVKHLSKQEMIDLIRFYQSTTGKAMITKMPVIMQESVQIAQTWASQALTKYMPKPPQ